MSINETDLYKQASLLLTVAASTKLQNKIGLRTLNKSGRLHFLAINGDHLRMSEEWFVKQIIKRYLK